MLVNLNRLLILIHFFFQKLIICQVGDWKRIFSCQGGSFSCIADRIAHNFEPWLEIVLVENSFNQNVVTDHLGNCLVNYNAIVSGDVRKAELSRKDFCNNNNNNDYWSWGNLLPPLACFTCRKLPTLWKGNIDQLHCSLRARDLWIIF